MSTIAKMVAAAMLLSAPPAIGQPPPRVLEVPATASWKHAATGMILPPNAAGLSRGAIVD